MRNRRARIVVVAALAATAVGACSSEQSKDDFIAAADDACREADERIRSIGRSRVGEVSRRYVDRAQDVAEELVSDLRALAPPEGDTRRVEQMIDGLERSADFLEPLAEAAADHDFDALEELQQEVRQTTDHVAEAAESYGFEVCGAKVFDSVR